MRRRGERAAGAAGLAVGVAVVLLLVSGWRVAGGDGRLGADLFFSVGPTGELAVTPSGPFLRATGLLPGQRADADLRLRNQTGSAIAVSLRALPERRDLDGLLLVTVRTQGRTLFSGQLGRLRAWSRPFRIGAGGHATLEFAASLPSDLDVGYQGRIASVPFELRARRAS